MNFNIKSMKSALKVLTPTVKNMCLAHYYILLFQDAEKL